MHEEFELFGPGHLAAHQAERVTALGDHGAEHDHATLLGGNDHHLVVGRVGAQRRQGEPADGVAHRKLEAGRQRRRAGQIGHPNPSGRRLPHGHPHRFGLQFDP